MKPAVLLLSWQDRTTMFEHGCGRALYGKRGHVPATVDRARAGEAQIRGILRVDQAFLECRLFRQAAGLPCVIAKPLTTQ